MKASLSRTHLHQAEAVPRRALFWHVARSLVLALALASLLGGCSPKDPVEEARELQNAGRYAESLEPLRRALAEGSDDPEVHFLYGRGLAVAESLTMAIWPLRKAMQHEAWLVPAAMQLSEVGMATGDYKLAVEAADRVLEVEPDNTGALLQRAMARIQTRRDYAGGLEDADRLLELDPDSMEAHVARAVALLGLQRPDEAGEVIDEIERRLSEGGLDLPSTGRYCAVRASFAKEKGNLELAEKLYGECLERFPGNFVLVEDAVQFHDSRGEVERSIEILREALAQNAQARHYRVSIVLRLQSLGRDEEAEALLREVTEAESKLQAAGGWQDLGGFLVAAGRYDEGVEAYANAVELAGEPSADLLFVYADALVMAERYDEALATADRMTVEAHAEMLRGRVYLNRGEPALALERLDAGLRLWPDNAIARHLAGLASEQVGDFDRAIEEYRYAIRAGAGQSDARLRLARLHMAEGRNLLALEALRHDISQSPSNLEMALVELEVLGRLRMTGGQLPDRIAQLIRSPEAWPRAVAALARGVLAADGPAMAVQVIGNSQAMDVTAPGNEEVLAELVDALIQGGEPAKARSAVEAALARQPDYAPFHALHGQLLAGTGAKPEETRASLDRALELDASQPLALRELARLEAEEGRPEQALSLYDRAAAADVNDGEAQRGAAAVLVASSRPAEAEQRLEQALGRNPYDGAAALALAQLRLEGGAEPGAVLTLARRAVRFQAGADAEALVAQLEESEGAGPG